jgi:hypothetical protein
MKETDEELDNPPPARKDSLPQPQTTRRQDSIASIPPPGTEMGYGDRLRSARCQLDGHRHRRTQA